jgi:hypothetical protein
MTRRAGLLALLCALAPAHGPAQETPANEAPAKKDPRARLAEPWPEEKKLRERRKDAEKRALFKTDAPLAFTLTADWKAVNGDRQRDSTKRFPAVLTVAGYEGETHTLQVTLGTRGKSRLDPRTCSFVPLRVAFGKGTKGTPFAGQQALKLVTHCQTGRDFEQIKLREYLAYRIFNLLTPHSFRARLSRGTYIDSGTGKTRATSYAMFVEAESDLARRMEGRIAALPRALFRDLDQDTLTLMMLFEYMIGNTDFSIHALHNVRLVQTRTALHPVPYDFDFSGFVHAPYASPARRLPIKSVLERLHRGPCRRAEELEPILAKFREMKQETLLLLESLPDLDSGSRREAKQYLEDFYSTISRKGGIKSQLVDTCTKGAGM